MNQQIQVRLVALKVKLELVKGYIVDEKQPQLARRVLKEAESEAAILTNNYPNEEPLLTIAYGIRSVVDGPDIDIVNMVNDLLHRITHST